MVQSCAPNYNSEQADSWLFPRAEGQYLNHKVGNFNLQSCGKSHLWGQLEELLLYQNPTATSKREMRTTLTFLPSCPMFIQSGVFHSVYYLWISDAKATCSFFLLKYPSHTVKILIIPQWFLHLIFSLALSALCLYNLKVNHWLKFWWNRSNCGWVLTSPCFVRLHVPCLFAVISLKWVQYKLLDFFPCLCHFRVISWGCEEENWVYIYSWKKDETSVWERLYREDYT